jgi:hypothetical protein
MIQKESLQLFGELTITLYDVKTGRLIRRMQKRNQITNVGRVVVCELLNQDAGGTPGQANPDYNTIGYLAIGTNVTPPQITDTALLAEVRRDYLDPAAVEIYTDPVLFEVVVSKLIPAGVATGSVFAEAGLFTWGVASGFPGDLHSRLYARQTHPPYTKTATTAVTYDWRLGVTVQV